jgi:hypothetical protein
VKSLMRRMRDDGSLKTSGVGRYAVV